MANQKNEGIAYYQINGTAGTSTKIVFPNIGVTQGKATVGKASFVISGTINPYNSNIRGIGGLSGGRHNSVLSGGPCFQNESRSGWVVQKHRIQVYEWARWGSEFSIHLNPILRGQKIIDASSSGNGFDTASFEWDIGIRDGTQGVDQNWVNIPRNFDSIPSSSTSQPADTYGHTMGPRRLLYFKVDSSAYYCSNGQKRYPHVSATSYHEQSVLNDNHWTGNYETAVLNAHLDGVDDLWGSFIPDLFKWNEPQVIFWENLIWEHGTTDQSNDKAQAKSQYDDNNGNDLSHALLRTENPAFPLMKINLQYYLTNHGDGVGSAFFTSTTREHDYNLPLGEYLSPIAEDNVSSYLKPQDYFSNLSSTHSDWDVHYRAFSVDGAYLAGAVANVGVAGGQKFDFSADWEWSSDTNIEQNTKGLKIPNTNFIYPNITMRSATTINLNRITAKSLGTSSRRTFNKLQLIITGDNGTDSHYFHNYDVDNNNGRLTYSNSISFEENYAGHPISISNSITTVKKTQTLSTEWKVYGISDTGQPNLTTLSGSNAPKIHIPGYLWLFDGQPDFDLETYNSTAITYKVKCTPNFDDNINKNARFKVIVKKLKTSTSYDVWEKMIHPNPYGGTDPSKDPVEFTVDLFNTSGGSNSYWTVSPSGKSYPFSSIPSEDVAIKVQIKAYDDNDNLLDSSQEIGKIVPHKPLLSITNVHVEEYKGDGGTIDWTAQLTMSGYMPNNFRPTHLHFWMAYINDYGNLGNYQIPNNTLNSQTLTLTTGHMPRLVNDTSVYPLGDERDYPKQNNKLYGTVFVSGQSNPNWGHVNGTFTTQSSFRFSDNFADLNSAELIQYNAYQTVKAAVDVAKIESKYNNPPSEYTTFAVEYKINPTKFIPNQDLILDFPVEQSDVTECEIGDFWVLDNRSIDYYSNPNHPYFVDANMNLQFRLTAKVGGVQVDQTEWTDISGGNTSWGVANKWYQPSTQLLEGYSLVADSPNHLDGQNVTILKSFSEDMNAATREFDPIIDLEIEFGNSAVPVDWTPVDEDNGHYYKIIGKPLSASGATRLDNGKVVLNYGLQAIRQISGTSSPEGLTLYFAKFRGQVGDGGDVNNTINYHARIVMKDHRSGQWQGVRRTDWQTLTIPGVKNNFPSYDAGGKNGGQNTFKQTPVTHLPGLRPENGALQESRLVFNFGDFNPWDANAPAEGKFAYTVDRYTLTGVLTEIPVATEAGVEDTPNAQLKKEFDSSTIVSSNWTVTGAVDTTGGNQKPGLLWEALLPQEAMYRSDIFLTIDEQIENSDFWKGIYDEHIKPQGENLIDIPSTLGRTRRFGNTDVIMNNISHGNLALLPTECELIPRSDGRYGLSGYTMKFKILADLSQYYTNVTPKIIFGARFKYHTPNSSNSASTIVALSGGNEERLGFTPFVGQTQAYSDDIKTKLIKNIQDLVVSDDGFIYQDVNLNFDRDDWGYNDKIKINEDINIEFCFYIEEEISSRVQGLSGNYFQPANQEDPWAVTVTATPPVDLDNLSGDHWFDINNFFIITDVTNKTLNLKSLIEAYKYYEDPELPGFIDLEEIDYGSFTLEEYEPTKLRFSNSNYVSPSNDFKKPFSHSTEVILATVTQNKSGSEFNSSSDLLSINSSNTYFLSLDKDGYVVNDSISYIARPKIATKTSFGKTDLGEAISYGLDIPMLDTSYFLELSNKTYRDTFVPSFSNFEITQNYPEDITQENAQTSTVEIKFNYNTSAFTDVNKYFATSHEHIKIMRTVVQSGNEITNPTWGLVYSGDIHSLSSGADNNGITTYSLTDSNIDTSALEGFNSNDFFRYNYSFAPGLSYTPGNVTQQIEYVNDKSEDVTIMPAHLPQTLPSPNNLSYRYNNKHSITVFWDYEVDNDAIEFLKSEGAYVGFDIFWKAVDEVDFYYQNPTNTQTRTRVDKVRERKYSSAKSTKEIDRIDNLKDWNLAKTITLSEPSTRSTSGNKFSHVLEYDKVSFKYGIQIAVIPKVIDNIVYSFFSHDISTHQNAASHVLGINEFTHPDGILVDPSDKSKRSKVHTEKERMKISDNIAKRNEDYIKHNIDQVPISVTRKRAQVNDLVDPNSEGGHNPYTST